MSSWDRAAMAARWTRDHLPAFTVSTVTFAALWAAIVLACVTLYIWDASFYRSLAPPGMELTFQAAGIVFRTFVIFGGLALVWMKANKLPSSASATLRFIWVMGLFACGVAALGFVTEGNDYHYRKNAAIVSTGDVTTESASTRIARIDAEKTAVRADRDRLIAGARESMALVLDDGIRGNDDLSSFEANIRQYEADAKAKLDRLDDQLEAVEAERLSAQTTATAGLVDEPPLPAVFVTPERYIPGFSGIIFRDVFAVFWVILLEACGSVGAQALLAVQMALSKRKAAQEAGRKGGESTAKRQRRKMIEYVNHQQRRTTDLTPDADDDNEDDGDTDADGNRRPQAAE